MLAHGLALYAVWISLAGWPRTLAVLAVAASLAGTLAQARMRVVALELHEDGRASWKDRLGAWHQGTLGRSHFVTAFLVVLELKPRDRGVKRLVVLADSAAADDFRRLRVWLRWRPVSADSGRNNLTED